MLSSSTIWWRRRCLHLGRQGLVSYIPNQRHYATTISSAWETPGLHFQRKKLNNILHSDFLLFTSLRQTCLLKILLSVIRRAYVCIFWFLTGFFLRYTTNQSKQNSVKGHFSIIHLVRTACQLTSSTIQMHYTRTTLSCLRLRKSFSIEDHKTLSQKTMHHVCCFCWCRRILSWTVVVWLEFVSLVLCILSPLRRFRAVTCHRQFWIQTRHIRRWLASVKFRCKVDVHWFKKLFWPIRTGRTLQSWKWLEICNCQHQCSTIGFAGNKLAFVHITFSVLSGNSVSVFWEIRVYIHTAGRFPY